jgi:NAD(P)-dependent dehydrogenase (short-subunit alcohol dehydrogenase family)
VDDWWADVAVNVRGTFLVTRAALNIMMRADRGIIVNMGGGRPPGGSGYAVAKAGVAEMTRALNGELRQVGSHVSVYLADPGLVDTDMSRLHARDPIAPNWVPDLVNRMGNGDTRKPEEIAGKLIGQLPYMLPATSGGFFDPDTPTGTFRSISGQ